MKLGQRRVVITGLGVVAPNGIGKEDFWQACISGRSGIRQVTHFDASSLSSRIAGEVPNFVPEAYGITCEETSNFDRNTQFALAAANLALEDAKLPNELSEAERNSMGVYIGSAMASVAEGEKLWFDFLDHQQSDSTAQSSTAGAGRQRGSPLPVALSLSGEQKVDFGASVPVTQLMIHAPAAAIAAHHGLHGPCMLLATACSAGADAIGEAFRAIQEEDADCVLAGGTDSAICIAGFAAFCILGAMSTSNDQPEKASRPYARQRDGFVMSEGAGVILLEERDHALARGAHIYAELIAFASNISAYHMTALPPDGAPLQQLLKQAMKEANVTNSELGYINSHGSSTPSNEVAETAAYKAVFGEKAYSIPISATKSMIGHAQGAASAIETVVTALVLERQVIPPTINQEDPDPACDLDYVPEVARHARVEVALTHSSGFGGVNNALILARSDWVDSHL